MIGDRKGTNGSLDTLRALLDSKYGVSLQKLAKDSRTSPRTVQRNLKRYTDAGFKVIRVGYRGNSFYRAEV